MISNAVGTVSFRSILVCPLRSDERPDPLRRVVELARRCDARITLLGILREPPRVVTPFMSQERLERIARAEHTAMEQRLDRMATQCDAPDAEVAVRVGNPALTIVAEVLAGGHDLVVVTSDEDREDRATLRRLLRKCPAPVWVIRPTRARVQRVMVSVSAEPDEEDLNRHLLDLGATVVGLGGGELHVVHAWQVFAEDALRLFGDCSDADIADLRREERSARDREVLALLETSAAATLDWTLHLEHGPPAPSIIDLVRRKRINLLVIGTVARTGFSGLLMGNTAEQVLDEVDCSVLTAKPEGFITPIAGASS
ncbi:MAG TPA: universal stress protein [Acidimicrobiales bacterium]|nr:universal stress protein [Acidimicrobiales bacterium]